MPMPTGFTIPLSLPRRLMADYVQYTACVPAGVVHRRLNLSRLALAREGADPRPGWCALFTKAWAFVCASRPILRRAYLAWPYARLYQHPVSTASIAVERPYGDEEAVFFLQISEPDKLAVGELDRRINSFKHGELGSNACVRRQLRVSALPSLFRRMFWWSAYNLGGRQRVRYFGTFGVTSTANLGATTIQPAGCQTTTLSYGIVDQMGKVDVQVGYDQRVLDAGAAARAICDLENVLNNVVATELGYLLRLEAA